MKDHPTTLRRFLFDYLIAFALILLGIVVSGVLAELIAPGWLFVKGVCFFLGLIPFVLWLRHCSVMDLNRWDVIRIGLLMLGMLTVIEIAPVGWHENIPFMTVTFGVLHWFTCWIIQPIRKVFGGAPPDAESDPAIDGPDRCPAPSGGQSSGARPKKRRLAVRLVVLALICAAYFAFLHDPADWAFNDGEFKDVVEIVFENQLDKELTFSVTDPKQIAQICQLIRLEPKEPCACDHIETACFKKREGEIFVYFCDHCFDVLHKGNYHTHDMPEAFYRQYQTLLKEHKSGRASNQTGVTAPGLETAPVGR